MLTGNKIILRSLRIQDKEKTIQWRNNLELINLTTGINFPKTDEMESAWFETVLQDKSNRNIYFGIDDIKTNSLAGLIHLNNIDWISRTCELGIIIGEKDMRGKGYGKEAMQLIISYAFKTINLRKITLKVVSHNQNAKTLYENLGFITEGKLSQQIYQTDKYHDIHILSLFKGD